MPVRLGPRDLANLRADTQASLSVNARRGVPHPSKEFGVGMTERDDLWQRTLV